jgi:ATP/maltotriose-dependent transcriptional regulator MalT
MKAEELLGHGGQPTADRHAVLATKPSPDAGAVYQRLHEDALGFGDAHTAKALAIRLVEALQITDRTEEAANVLARALRSSATSGVFQTFIDSGTQVRTLLIAMQVNAEHAHRDFLPFLKTIVRPRQSPARPMPETPLSPREHGVLQLICSGLSNKRIARELEIAPETVKSHAKHILVKLKAQTRAEAVARAAALNLI